MEWEARSKNAVAAGAIFLIVAAVAFLLRQENQLIDGQTLIAAVERGDWVRHHALYLPIAHVVHWVTSPLPSWTAELSLSLLSAGASGVACAVFYLAAVAFGLRRSTALAATALLATSPGVWFFATTIEVHTLQLAFAALLLLWAARGRETGFTGSAVVPALLLVGLTGAHMTGLLWGPALAYVVLRGGGTWKLPRHWIGALAILALFVAFWFLVNVVPAGEAREPGGGHAKLALGRWLTIFRPELLGAHLGYFGRVMLAPSGVLVLFALVGLVRGRRAWRRPVPPLYVGALLVFLAFLPFGLTLHFEDRGAYFLSFVPVVAAVACFGLDGIAPWGALLAAPLLGVQIYVASEQVREWDQHFYGWEWATVLFEETGERGTIVTLHGEEAYAVRGHSDMGAINVEVRRERHGAELQEAVLYLVGRAMKTGDPVAITRTMLDSDDPEIQALVAELIARHGEPSPGRRPEYLFFP